MPRKSNGNSQVKNVGTNKCFYEDNSAILFQSFKLGWKDENVISAFCFIVGLRHSVSVDVLFDVTGTRGRERGEFSNLQGISTTSNGRIVVADSNNQCIQVRIYSLMVAFNIWWYE